MKIERINENQIRCTLSRADLNMRNLNVGELAYGGDKARNLFREMLQRAHSEVGFEAEDMPLMVEAIPMAGESVMLIITTVEEPDEVDTRFARFAPSNENYMEGFPNLPVIEGLDGADSISIKQDTTPSSVSLPVRIYSFNSLDDIISASKAVAGEKIGPNRLYKNPSDGMFYLVITNDGTDADAFSNASNILLEYGKRVMPTYGSMALYDEHYDIIIGDNALGALANI